MTSEEIIAYQAKEREFLASPIGKAFNKFKNAYFSMAADEHRENVSGVTLRKKADAANVAEQEVRDELDRLRARDKEFCLILETILNGSGYPSYTIAERVRALIAPVPPGKEE